MKKTILVSLAGLALLLAGCTQQTPVSNQNVNQPTANVNQNVNVYVAHDDRILTKPSWLTSNFVDGIGFV